MTEPDPMREHGFHHWTAKNGQEFWCRCARGKDHKAEPRWEE